VLYTFAIKSMNTFRLLNEQYYFDFFVFCLGSIIFLKISNLVVRIGFSCVLYRAKYYNVNNPSTKKCPK